jgi:hypothetical protein
VLELSPGARSLEGCYGDEGPGRAAYARMVEQILAPVRAGRRVCAAFYGHPGVFVLPSNEAIARARAEGFAAQMLPGISAEDCLLADLGVDPARDGLQSWEASTFLRRRPAVEPTAALVLWQVGVLGERLGPLVERLLALYPRGHEAIVYQASGYPGIAPLVRRVALGELAAALTPSATLFVPGARR